MSDWSPYTRAPLPPHDAAYWAWLAYVHTAAYGTPLYERLNAERRAEFEKYLAEGSWQHKVQLLNMEAARVGVVITPAMDPTVAQALAGGVSPATPLTPAGRSRCVAIAAEWHRATHRLEVEYWKANPGPPAAWVEPQPGEPEAAEEVFARLVAGELRGTAAAPGGADGGPQQSAAPDQAAADREARERAALAALLTVGPNAAEIARRVEVKRTTLLGWPEFRKHYDRAKVEAAANRRARRGRRAGAADFADDE